MKNIQVNVTDTDKNIDKATGHNASYFQEWSDTSWQTGRGQDGVYNLNQWYTYTVDADGTVHPEALRAHDRHSVSARR